jgi:hypothetical protein
MSHIKKGRGLHSVSRIGAAQSGIGFAERVNRSRIA